MPPAFRVFHVRAFPQVGQVSQMLLRVWVPMVRYRWRVYWRRVRIKHEERLIQHAAMHASARARANASAVAAMSRRASAGPGLPPGPSAAVGSGALPARNAAQTLPPVPAPEPPPPRPRKMVYIEQVSMTQRKEMKTRRVSHMSRLFSPFRLIICEWCRLLSSRSQPTER